MREALTLLGVSVEVVIGESLQCCFPEVESLGDGCGYKEGLMEVVRLSDRSIELDASLVLEISCSNIVHQGCYQGSVLMIQDVSERHRYQQQLMRATQKDGMTGLFNRDFFSVYLAKALHQVRRQDRSIAVLIIDLNDFKLVNDTMGHNVGDELIREVSLRLQRSIRCSDIVARLGGDEFAVAIEESKESMPYASMHVANTIHQQFSKEIQLKRKPFSLFGDRRCDIPRSWRQPGGSV